MFGRTRYLEWAMRHYGRARFDLATSGVAPVRLEDIGPPDLRQLDSQDGPTLLREAVARYHAVSPAEVVPALGTTHALWLAYASLTCPGDEVIVEEPAYEPLVRIAEGCGARVVRFTRDAEGGFALDPERIARVITSRTRVVAITNLHNPSGVRVSGDDLEAIARLAESHGAHLLVDEVYAPFDALVDAGGVFAGSARRLAPNIVAVGSLTKCYGLGALRAGWLLAPPEVVHRAEDAVMASCGMLPPAHAHLVLGAFARVDHLAHRARAQLAGKRQRVAAWTASHGLSWSSPAEGLFGLAVLPGAGDLTDRVEAAVRDHEVLVAPGSFFGVPSGFRLAWSTPAELLDEGLSRLASALGLAHG